MTPDAMRWAKALLIEKQHGDRAVDWLSDRVQALAIAGDQAGVDRMMELARRLDLLREGSAH